MNLHRYEIFSDEDEELTVSHRWFPNPTTDPWNKFIRDSDCNWEHLTGSAYLNVPDLLEIIRVHESECIAYKRGR